VEKLENLFAPLTAPSELEALCLNYTKSLKDSTNPVAWPLLASNGIMKQFLLRDEEFDTLREDAKDFYERPTDLGLEDCSYAERKNKIHCQQIMKALLGEVENFMGVAKVVQLAKTLFFNEEVGIYKVSIGKV
jgi:hypothetical protein